MKPSAAFPEAGLGAESGSSEGDKAVKANNFTFFVCHSERKLPICQEEEEENA